MVLLLGYVVHYSEHYAHENKIIKLPLTFIAKAKSDIFP
jgi:hypothetical protein